jgi:hypothetical protein
MAQMHKAYCCAHISTLLLLFACMRKLVAKDDVKIARCCDYEQRAFQDKLDCSDSLLAPPTPSDQIWDKHHCFNSLFIQNYLTTSYTDAQVVVTTTIAYRTNSAYCYVVDVRNFFILMCSK